MEILGKFKSTRRETVFGTLVYKKKMKFHVGEIGYVIKPK